VTDPSWIEAQRRHFDAGRESYSRMYGEETAFHRGVCRRFIEFAGARAGMEVLDLGCGFGRLTFPLLEAGCRVTGLDLSAPTLAELEGRVRERGLGERFIAQRGAAEEISAEGRFELVLGRGFMHHVKDPGPVLERCRRALVPHGKVAFLDPNPLQPAWLAFTLLHPAFSFALERHIRRGTPRRLRRIIAASGFVGFAHRFAGLAPPPFWRLAGAAHLEERLARIPGLRTQALYMMVRAQRPPDAPDL
jgi:2-polyprenyl-3-methyl-5-hydroxy-6-metoxy-1,4-benzoquinol methylase